MAVAPFISLLREQGGTFYTFQSGIRDERRSRYNNNYRFVFSSFAALNIPKIQRPVNNENFIQFNTIDGAIFNSLSPDVNINLVESLQNYCLNLETLLINLPTYDNLILKSVAERVFFKWLKEIGAIRFRNSNDVESTTVRFTEESTKRTGSTLYEEVVKYIGTIDIINNIDKGGDAYTELYIQIPTTVGNTPTILFNSISDNNYKPDMIIQGGSEFIENRTLANIHPDALRFDAFYDYDVPMTYTNSTNADWFNSLLNGTSNCYFTEPNTFSSTDNINIIKHQNDYIPLGASDFSTTTYLRSKLDGISLEFDPNVYYDIFNSNMKSIQQYNSSAKSNTFDFNAILIYYDFYNTSNPNEVVKNLYGILFLDNITPTTNGGYIQTFTKYKYNSLINQNGNSYGLSLNTKTSASIGNDNVTSVVNDYNTFSMSLFLDSMTQLQYSSKKLIDNTILLNNINIRIEAIENLLVSIPDSNILQARVDDLQNQLVITQLAYKDSSTLLNLISSLEDRFNSLLNGRLTLQMQYNSDILQAGSGILLDRSIPNKVLVTNNIQEYTINNVYDSLNNIIDITNYWDLNSNENKFYVKLQLYNNYIKIYSIENSILINDINIYIDDSSIYFKKGQLIKLIFNNSFNINEFNINIYTDKNNNFNLGSYKKLIRTIYQQDLLSNKPIIELICLDDINYVFDFNVIR